MRDKRPMIPYGGQFVEDSGLALLYVGGSVAWSLTKADRNLGCLHVMCLPNIHHAAQYRYPIRGTRVVCHIYEYPEGHDLKLLNQVLFREGAIETAFWVAGMAPDEDGNHPILAFKRAEVASHG